MHMSNPSVAIEEKIRKTVSSSERIADELRRGRPTPEAELAAT
jgi:hypothetical protein